MLKWVESFNKTVSRRTYLQSCQHTEPDTQGDGNVPVLRLGHSHRLLQSQPLLTVQQFNPLHKENMRRAASEAQANEVGYLSPSNNFMPNCKTNQLKAKQATEVGIQSSTLCTPI
jgi:hypothetical protein